MNARDLQSRFIVGAGRVRDGRVQKAVSVVEICRIPSKGKDPELVTEFLMSSYLEAEGSASERLQGNRGELLLSLFIPSGLQAYWLMLLIQGCAFLFTKSIATPRALLTPSVGALLIKADTTAYCHNGWLHPFLWEVKSTP